jgi:hypothetical protein
MSNNVSHLNNPGIDRVLPNDASFVETPSTKAYFIGGHGSEGNGKFEVPKKCIIVAKAYPGQRTYVSDEICQLSPDILKNPIKNKVKIHEAFGTVAIYTPGQMCPNFEYTLLSCYPSDKPINKCSSLGSGVIDLDLFYEDSNLKCYPGTRIKNEQPFEMMKIPDIRKYVGNLYKYSLVPKPDDILNYVDILKNEGITLLPDILDNISKKSHITQNVLCDNLPGVYYNFVCRANEASETMYKGEQTLSSNRLFYEGRNVLHNNVQFIEEERKEMEKKRKKKELGKKEKELMANFQKMMSNLSKVQQEKYTNSASFNNLSSEYKILSEKQDKTENDNITLKMVRDKMDQLVNKSSKTQANIKQFLEKLELQREMLRNIRDQTYSIQQTPSNPIAKTIKSQIEESLVHRKPFIRNVYTPEYVSQQRQKEYNELNALIKRNEYIISFYPERPEGVYDYYKNERESAMRTLKNSKEKKLHLQKINHPELFLKNGKELKGGYIRNRNQKRSRVSRRTKKR